MAVRGGAKIAEKNPRGGMVKAPDVTGGGTAFRRKKALSSRKKA